MAGAAACADAREAPAADMQLSSRAELGAAAVRKHDYMPSMRFRAAVRTLQGRCRGRLADGCSLVSCRQGSIWPVCLPLGWLSCTCQLLGWLRWAKCGLLKLLVSCRLLERMHLGLLGLLSCWGLCSRLLGLHGLCLTLHSAGSVCRGLLRSCILLLHAGGRSCWCCSCVL